MIKHTEVMKLALEALKSCDAAHITDGGRQWYDEKLVDKAVEAIEKALTSVPDWASEAIEQPAQQEPVSDRENAIIRFALHQFMSNAYSHMNAAAQDKDSRHYTVSAVEKFAKDAKDAEALLSRLQFKAPKPAQRTWVGLTDEQYFEIGQRHWLPSIKVEKIHKEIIEAAHGITKEQT